MQVQNRYNKQLLKILLMFQLFCSKTNFLRKNFVFLQFMLFSPIRLDMSEKYRPIEEATSSASSKKREKYFTRSMTEYEETYNLI